MARKNRRDPFAGVPRPSGSNPRAVVLERVLGRMRNIMIEKHAVAGGERVVRGAAALLEVAGRGREAGLREVAGRGVRPGGDVGVRAREACEVLRGLGEARYGRWADRLEAWFGGGGDGVSAGG